MRSKDVAELAGVSVRTLRHYHQIGILPEPVRDSNGYRNYALFHVATLLRIRRLADLGVALEHMPDLLTDTTVAATSDATATPHSSATPHSTVRSQSSAASAQTVLADLDRELKTQIGRLQEQRRQIAGLLAEGQRPDLPPGPSVGSPITDLSAAVADLERDAGIVIATVGSESYIEDLHQLAEAVTRADLDGSLSDIIVRFRDLDPAAPDDEVTAIASELTHVLGAALTDLQRSGTGQQLAQTPPGRLPTLEADPRLNPAQLEALQRLSDWLATGTGN